ncbi:MAG TPA: hypothetical protein PKA10_10135 [Selenomonadales bacterium]|nr:hypothetical protein [Selenomonadales bacterium]
MVLTEKYGTKSDLTGKVQLPPAEPADRQEAAAESGEAEWPALSLDWKSGQENRSGDRSLLPYLTGTVFSSQRDAALQQMDISREYRFALQHQYTAKAYFGDKPVDQSAVSVEYTLDQPLQFGWGLSAGTREATPAKEHSFGEWVDAISISFPPIKFAGAGVLLAANISPKVLKTVGMVRGSKFASEALDLARGPSKAAEGIADAERIVAQDARKISNAKNYRDLFLKENPGMPKELQVHHTLPQKYQEILNGKGINIHETKYLEGIDPDIHRLVTKEWQRWEKSLGRTPTAEEVIDFAKQIDSKYSEFWYKK